MPRRTLALLLLLAGASALRADDEEPQPQAVIDRAVKASGGPDRLAQLRGFSRKATGKLLTGREPISFQSESLVAFPDRAREALTTPVDGAPLTILKVLSGDKGWVKEGEQTEEMEPAALAEEQEQLHAAWVATLLPLRDKEYALTLREADTVGDRPAVSVRVTHKGRRPVALYFDKEKGWLLKYEVTVRAAGREVRQEVVFSDHRPADGLVRPRKVVIKRDGRPFLELDVTEFKPVEKVDDKSFARP
jgi:hypothetical protein